jgi:hypothetical protein
MGQISTVHNFQRQNESRLPKMSTYNISNDEYIYEYFNIIHGLYLRGVM